MNQPYQSSERVLAEETAVIQFLKRHPDFFQQHPELLMELQLGTQEDGKIVPLMERQVQALRHRQLDLGYQLRAWADAARIQERQEQRMHQVVCTLTAVDTVAKLQDELPTVLRREFSLTAVILWLPAASGQEGSTSTTESEQKTRLLERVVHGRSVCDDRLPSELLYALFAVDEARIASVALVPVIDRHTCGLLALGADEKDRFQPQMDTIFLDRLSELVSSAVARITRRS